MPEITALNEPYWNGLADGVLKFQRCDDCQHAWLPAREECPRCLGAGMTWTPASGRGRIISWVVYHTALHPSFKDRLPYNVAIVELDEGPRLITNILANHDSLAIEQPVVLAIEPEGDMSLPRFRPSI